jgi:ribosomal protein S18 acetylase RimI-like enzyme
LIRSAIAVDVPTLVEIARDTNVFKPVELLALREVLDDFVARPGGDRYHAYTFEQAGRVLGFEIHGPNTMTDRTWDLYWIAVVADRQARGIGTQLLHFAEADIRKHNGRLIVIETSTLPTYDATRRFYLKHGYEPCVGVPDFYADGDGKVVFWKRLRDCV